MKEIKAYVRVERIDKIIHSLKIVGIQRMSITHVQAVGSSIDLSEAKLSVELTSRYANVAKLEIVCPESRVEEIISIIQREGHTGHTGDGIIYVSSVEKAVKIRTGEYNLDALA